MEFRVNSLIEKGSGALNEDVLLQEDRVFGVFDGATSLNRKRYFNGLTGGLLAARTAASAFSASNCPLMDSATIANHHIRQAQVREKVNLARRQNLWSTSMAVIRLDDDKVEYCQTGDATILLILDDGTYKVISADTDIDRKTLQLWKESQTSDDTNIQELLKEQIIRVRLEMNVSYGVLNGEKEALSFIRHGQIDRHDISDILIFTDGLMLPREDPHEEHDWQEMVNLFHIGGLQAVRNHIRRLQQTDKTCRQYPRFKQHDDIAAVSISY